MQGGYLSLLYSTSEKPLEYWSKQKSKTGVIKRVLDEDINENVGYTKNIIETEIKKIY